MSVRGSGDPFATGQPSPAPSVSGAGWSQTVAPRPKSSRSRMYVGDIREVFSHPLAYKGGIAGTVLSIIVVVVLALTFDGTCEERLRESWLEQDGDVWSSEFISALQRSCPADTTVDPEKCTEDLLREWRRTSLVAYSLPFGLALSESCPADEEEMNVVFDPGTIMRLGEAIDVVPEDVVPPPEKRPKQVVTDRDEPEPPKPRPKKPREREPRKPKLPAVGPGSPFGSPRGWSDLQKKGDPWATAVTEALNNLPVGAYGGRIESGNFKFQLTICKDGRIREITRKGGSIDQDTRDAVEFELRRIKLPAPPPSVRADMRNFCARLPYTFDWSREGVL